MFKPRALTTIAAVCVCAFLGSMSSCALSVSDDLLARMVRASNVAPGIKSTLIVLARASNIAVTKTDRDAVRFYGRVAALPEETIVRIWAKAFQSSGFSDFDAVEVIRFFESPLGRKVAKQMAGFSPMVEAALSGSDPKLKAQLTDAEASEWQRVTAESPSLRRYMEIQSTGSFDEKVVAGYLSLPEFSDFPRNFMPLKCMQWPC